MNSCIFYGAGLLIFIGIFSTIVGGGLQGEIWAIGGLVLMWIGIAGRK